MTKPRNPADWNPWTWPNLISVARVGFAPVFVWLFVQGRYGPAAAVFLGAGLSDGVDGLLARLLNQRSRLGMLLDPLADKILLDCAMLALGLSGWLPLPLAMLVVARDAAIMAGLAVLGLTGRLPVEPLSPTKASKLNTLCQILLVALALAGRVPALDFAAPDWLLTGLMLAVAGLTAVSSVQYGRRGLRLWKRENPFGAAAPKPPPGA